MYQKEETPILSMSQNPNMAEIQDGSVSVGRDLTAFALKKRIKSRKIKPYLYKSYSVYRH